MKIFLTGGTGFVGSHFLKMALKAGHEVVALRRPSSKNRIELPEQPQWLDGSLDGDYSLAMQECTAFVHLAAHSANTPYDNIANCLYWNVQASIQLAMQAQSVGIQHYLIAGSCFEYGSAAQRYEEIPTDAPLEPTLSYPTSKAAASIAFMGFTAEYALKTKICRLFQVYGEGELSSRFWPSLKKAAEQGDDFRMSRGEQIRDFIEVEEVAKQLLDNLHFNEIQSGETKIKHIASGNAISLAEFARKKWAELDATGKLITGVVPYRSNELMRLIPKLDKQIG